jgi:hypothetical protein
MNEPVQFPAPPRFQPVVDQSPGPDPALPSLVDMARAVAAICASRILLLLAVLTSAVIWTWTTIDPTQLRIISATAYSVVAVWPLVLLYARKG